MRRLQLVAVAGVMALGLAGTASGQDSAPARRGYVRLPGMVIHGRPQRPGAELVLTRSRSAYEVRELRTSFVRGVLRSVDRRPF